MSENLRVWEDLDTIREIFFYTLDTRNTAQSANACFLLRDIQIKLLSLMS